MSVKKAGSPFSSGADPIDQSRSSEEASRAGSAEKSFESALAEAASELDHAGGTSGPGSELQTEFRRIAGSTNFDSPESEAAAIQESAHVLVNSRLGKGFQESDEG